LHAVLAPLGISHELLFVDDGSSDGMTQALLCLAHNAPYVTALILERHAGKEAALAAGLSQACGRAVIIMDADLQDPPALIPDMLQAWRAGADVVRMCRQPAPGVSWLRQLADRGLRRVLDIMGDVGMPEHSTDFMLFDRKAVAALNLVVQRKRYMDPLFAWMGLRQRVIGYRRQPRAAGASSWCLTAFLGLTPRGVTHPVDAGLRVLMALALVVAAAGLFGVLGAVLWAQIAGAPVAAAAIQAGAQVMVWAAVSFFSGWAGKVLRRMRFDTRRPRYAIRVLKRAQRNRLEYQTCL